MVFAKLSWSHSIIFVMLQTGLSLCLFYAGRKVRTAESNTPVNGRSRYRGDLYHSGDGKESATENYRPVLIVIGMG